MNPRQRRGVLLVAVSVIGAIAVFLSVSGFVADIASQVGPVTQVVRLTTDVNAFEPVPEESLELVDMPRRWLPPLALEATADIAERVPAVALPAGTVLQEGDLTDPPSIPVGQRQIAILVDAETGVAGNIGVGDIVDIVATRQGFEQDLASAEIAIEAARILSIGAPQPDDAPDASTGFAGGEVVPITFVLPTDDVLRLAYVESFASTVRLALRAPNDETGLAPPERVYAPGPAQEVTP